MMAFGVTARLNTKESWMKMGSRMALVNGCTRMKSMRENGNMGSITARELTNGMKENSMAMFMRGNAKTAKRMARELIQAF